MNLIYTINIISITFVVCYVRRWLITRLICLRPTCSSRSRPRAAHDARKPSVLVVFYVPRRVNFPYTFLLWPFRPITAVCAWNNACPGAALITGITTGPMDRRHSPQLPEHSAHLSDCNFITHMLYKNTY